MLPSRTTAADPFGPKRSIVPSSPFFQKMRPNQKAGFTNSTLYSSSKYHLFNRNL